MYYISILIYVPENILEKLFEMCNYYFQYLFESAPKNRKPNSTSNNKRGIPIKKISHIKTLHRTFTFVKIFHNVFLYDNLHKAYRIYLILL